MRCASGDAATAMGRTGKHRMSISCGQGRARSRRRGPATGGVEFVDQGLEFGLPLIARRAADGFAQDRQGMPGAEAAPIGAAHAADHEIGRGTALRDGVVDLAVIGVKCQRQPGVTTFLGQVGRAQLCGALEDVHAFSFGPGHANRLARILPQSAASRRRPGSWPDSSPACSPGFSWECRRCRQAGGTEVVSTTIPRRHWRRVLRWRESLRRPYCCLAPSVRRRPSETA